MIIFKIEINEKSFYYCKSDGLNDKIKGMFPGSVNNKLNFSDDYCHRPNDRFQYISRYLLQTSINDLFHRENNQFYRILDGKKYK